MTVYYNEIDPFAAKWLENLISAGHIADGVVDTRSIVDVKPNELGEFTQCHFFAGIGVWSYALRNAGWPDDRPVWTGSCPCQPFSAAGQGEGFADERHLWPYWFWLIDECQPADIFGEQVASKDGLAWLDLVQSDLEASGYTVGAADICAAGVGAPHIRQRLWLHAERLANPTANRWHQGVQPISGRSPERIGGDSGDIRVGDTDGSGPQEHGESGELYIRQQNGADTGRQHIHAGISGRMADAEGGGWARRSRANGSDRSQAGDNCESGGVADASGNGRDEARQRVTKAGCDGAVGNSTDGGMADTSSIRSRRGCDGPNESEARELETHDQVTRSKLSGEAPTAGPTNGLWRVADWLFCRDGKWRPVRSSTFPLVDGSANRVGRLRGYGNAINAEVAKIFIEASVESSER